jgi:DNA modification methylase
MESTFEIKLGDCLESLKQMPDQSVHCCVTSPPYFGLRDYGVDGQIGLEPTPDDFVQALVAVFREVRRVLRDDGTLWLNLGDSYSSGGRTWRAPDTKAPGAREMSTRPDDGMKPKDLIGIPWMVAFALRADGWYLRQDIIWNKPNPMPESVRDRCTKAHEYVFLLSKSPRYYFDSEAVKEDAVSDAPSGNGFAGRQGGACDRPMSGGNGTKERWQPGGKRNRRSVWSVTTKPFKGAHFATFPPELIQPCILAGCPVGGTVLDPFGGSGTTAGVALAHDRSAVLCELNPEYAELVPARIASILEIYGKKPKAKRKPRTPADPQKELFDGAQC